MFSGKLRLALAALSICALTSTTSFGQVRPSEIREYSNNYYEWGILAGGNFQQMIAYPFKPAYGTGGVAGAYIKRRMQRFSLQAGLNVSSAHYETDYPATHKFMPSHTIYADTTSLGIFDAAYITIPVVAEIRPLKRLTLRMGAAYSYLVYINDNNGAYSKTGDAQKLFKSSNVSGTAGLEFDINKKLKIGASYYFGVLDVNNQKFQGLNDMWHTNSATVTLAYRIKKWASKKYAD